MNLKSRATHLISQNPPALRAIVTNSLPYLSSADALSSGQTISYITQKGGTTLLYSQFKIVFIATNYLIFKRSSMSLHMRRPSQSLCIRVSYPTLLMKSTP